jgi:ribosomal protein S18 acetylase RimI-like enzyme
VIIRNVGAMDAEPLADLARRLGLSIEASRFGQDIATYAAGFYVAEFSQGIRGYLVMRAEHPPGCVLGQTPVQLWRLFVAPEYQGKGVAASLMSQAFAYARANAHDVVWLGTSEDNARAIAFYRKSGFSPIGVASLHQGHDSHQDLILSCELR